MRNSIQYLKLKKTSDRKKLGMQIFYNNLSEKKMRNKVVEIMKYYGYKEDGKDDFSKIF